MPTAEPLSLQIAIEPVTRRERLQTLADAWHRLWRRCPEASVAQQPEVALRCNAAAATPDLHALALFSEQRLVGLVPLRFARTAQERTLMLFRDENDGAIDAMIEPGFERAASAAIFEYLVQHADDWDACDFAQLCPGSVLLSPEVPLSWSDRIEENMRASDQRIFYRRVLRRAA